MTARCDICDGRMTTPAGAKVVSLATFLRRQLHKANERDTAELAERSEFACWDPDEEEARLHVIARLRASIGWRESFLLMIDDYEQQWKLNKEAWVEHEQRQHFFTVVGLDNQEGE